MASPKSRASVYLAQIEQNLTDSDKNGCSALAICGKEKTAKLLSAVRRQSQDYAKDLSELCLSSHESMKKTRHEPLNNSAWRSLFTDAALVWSLLDILEDRESPNIQNEKHWRAVVERLDNAIVIAGAPGESRLDLILDTIELIQFAFLPPLRAPSDKIIPPLPNLESIEVLPTALNPVPVLDSPPSMSAFRETFSRMPFILRRFADDWPAVNERKWASKEHLQSIAGRGRIVPIEIGSNYLTDDWTQRLMEWDEFLDYLFLDVRSSLEGQREVMYLAQHDLLKQFPALRGDVCIPDYVYAPLPPPEHYPQYRHPANDEELVINTWIGPKGTISPAHIDPFFNFYTQAVGRKTVWLAPPSTSPVLSPCPETLTTTSVTDPASPSHFSSNLNSTENERSHVLLSNTSRFDVFAPISDHQFNEMVVPVAMSAVLDEGDMLFFPPRWWHALRSDSTSFSVSMWF